MLLKLVNFSLRNNLNFIQSSQAKFLAGAVQRRNFSGFDRSDDHSQDCIKGKALFERRKDNQKLGFGTGYERSQFQREEIQDSREVRQEEENFQKLNKKDFQNQRNLEDKNKNKKQKERAYEYSSYRPQDNLQESSSDQDSRINFRQGKSAASVAQQKSDQKLGSDSHEQQSSDRFMASAGDFNQDPRQQSASYWRENHERKNLDMKNFQNVDDNSFKQEESDYNYYKQFDLNRSHLEAEEHVRPKLAKDQFSMGYAQQNFQNKKDQLSQRNQSQKSTHTEIDKLEKQGEEELAKKGRVHKEPTDPSKFL
eukprot:403346320